MDITQVPYLSSAGLRLILSRNRQIQSKQGKLILAGLSAELQDTLSITGFLDFFTTVENIETAKKTYTC